MEIIIFHLIMILLKVFNIVEMNLKSINQKVNKLFKNMIQNMIQNMTCIINQTIQLIKIIMIIYKKQMIKLINKIIQHPKINNNNNIINKWIQL